MNNKPVIALLFGGTSPERAISKLSGASVYKALISLGYSVKLIDPAYGTNQPADHSLYFEKDDLTGISNANYLKAFNSELFDGIDLAFIILHGKWGEDGTVQSLLELKGIPYTGSKVLSSALAMDKALSKTVFMQSNIPTAKWISAEKNYDVEIVKSFISANTGFPVVIKPNDQGSTVGLTVCNDYAEIDNAILKALEYSDKALIEEYIPGREMTVGIIDDKPLPVLEIKPKNGLYDYECKYTPGMSEYEVPAKISSMLFNELQHLSVRAYKALNCSGFARVDFRVSPDDKPYCLEVNTLPGMTSTSLVPKMAKSDGISFEELIDKIIRISY